MYARQVSRELRPDRRVDFVRRTESEVLPLLRKQNGFKDAITFVIPAAKDALAVSLWDSKESAEACNRTTFAEVTRLLSKLVEGTPRVKSYEVAHCTFHKIAATSKAA